MKKFAQLLTELELKSEIDEKMELLTGYFPVVPADEKTVAIALLRGQMPRRCLSNNQLKEWALELSGIPGWLFEEAYRMVGDMAETIALLLPPGNTSGNKSLGQWVGEIRGLKFLDKKEQKTWVWNSWQELGPQERFILNKLLAGVLRPALPPNLLVSALSRLSGLDPAILAWRLSQSGESTDYEALTQGKTLSDEHSLPYPMPVCLALEEECPPSGLEKELGQASDWLAEWKWEGLPVQVIRREDEIHIWTAREELVTQDFPELHEFMRHLPEGTVLEGELLTFREGRPIPSAGLQKRIGRKSVSKKLLEHSPVAFLAFDCLEYQGKDIRSSNAGKRRQLLENIYRQVPSNEHFQLSSLIHFGSWEELAKERESARDRMAEGILLKKEDAPVKENSRDRRKWKAEPFRIRGVLLYARKDTRTGLYTNFSLAVWEKEELVSFANVDSNLSEEETEEINAFIKENSLEKFGPVRTVKAGLVFEIAFDSIFPSPRRKSGLAVNSPRIICWLKNRKPEEAASLEELKAFALTDKSIY